MTDARTVAPQPAATITDWLSAELDKKLATLSDDGERYQHLIRCAGVWRQKYDAFASFGTQPFNCPHPVYGDMDAFDFTLLLAAIELRKAQLEKVPA